MALDRRKLLVAAALSTGLVAAAAETASAGGAACRQAMQAEAARTTAFASLATKLAGNARTIQANRARAAANVVVREAMKLSCQVGNGKRPMYDLGACTRDLQIVIAAEGTDNFVLAEGSGPAEAK
jgi:hypothetical protein